MSKIAIILGAGATTGSGYRLVIKGNKKEKIPTDVNFLKTVFENRIHEESKKEVSDALKEVSKDLKIDPGDLLFDSFDSLMQQFGIRDGKPDDKEYLGLEETWNTVVLNDKFIKLSLVRFNTERIEKNWSRTFSEPPQIKIRKFADYFLRILVQKVYGEMIDYSKGRESDSDSFKSMFKLLGIKEHKDLKNKIRNNISFITFNYDLCLENSLWEEMDKQQYFYYSNFDDNYIAKARMLFPIHKLHGSLNWWHGFDGNVKLLRRGREIIEPIPIKQVNYFKEGTRESWEKYQPSIIPADFLKEELFSGEGQERLHRHYMKLWAKAGRALQEADTIVIIGYSFPPADPHARWLVRASRSGLFYREKACNLKGVYFLTYCGSQIKETTETIKSLFGHEPEVYSEGFEKCLQDKHLEKWLGKVLRKNRTKS